MRTLTEVVETTILSTFFQQRMVSCYHQLTKATSMQCSQGTAMVILRCHCRVAGKTTPIQLIFFFKS